MVEAGAHDIPLVIETGQVIDTHHVALLVAAGASAVFPYLALEQAEGLKPDGSDSYRGAVEKGLRKVIARMGISTLASYRNSHLFEIIGLDPDVCNEFFEDAKFSSLERACQRFCRIVLIVTLPPFSTTHGALAGQRALSFPAPGRAACEFA